MLKMQFFKVKTLVRINAVFIYVVLRSMQKETKKTETKFTPKNQNPNHFAMYALSAYATHVDLRFIFQQQHRPKIDKERKTKKNRQRMNDLEMSTKCTI